MDTIVRVHKSHYFAYHLDKIRELFPNDSIVLVSQSNYKCFLWWEISGGHNIVYNNYNYYKKDYSLIWEQIVNQNTAIDNFIDKHNLKKVINIMLILALSVSLKKLTSLFIYTI